MTPDAVPVRCEAEIAWLQPGYATCRIGGRAGRQSGDDEADLMLFAASWQDNTANPLVRFFGTEMATLGWLEDFLLSETLQTLVASLQLPEDEAQEEDEEIIYDRRAVSPNSASDVFDP